MPPAPQQHVLQLTAVTLHANNPKEVEGGLIVMFEGALVANKRARHVTDGLQCNPLACVAGVTLRDNNLKELEGDLLVRSEGDLVANKQAQHVREGLQYNPLA